ncbi:hypothetical protein [Pendulispora albinea]|uniref:Recombinase A n=1 Tax=Pendulispora albinea TaxID=2741071 RepID=A0ABZ2LKQ1_9BACT
MGVARLQEIFADFGSKSAELASQPDAIHALGWPHLEALLPDRGFLRGTVVELASPNMLGGGMHVALAAVRAALSKDANAFVAWLDPYETLYAPGIARVGIDLERLLVVRPAPSDLGRIAVKVVGSGAFEMVVVEMAPVPGASAPEALVPRGARKRRPLPNEVMVRKLSLLAAKEGTTVVLLTDSNIPRSLPWPVALRLELGRRPNELSVRVAKDRRGRMGPLRTWIPLDDLGRNHEPAHPLPHRE